MCSCAVVLSSLTRWQQDYYLIKRIINDMSYYPWPVLLCNKKHTWLYGCLLMRPRMWSLQDGLYSLAKIFTYRLRGHEYDMVCGQVKKGFQAQVWVQSFGQIAYELICFASVLSEVMKHCSCISYSIWPKVDTLSTPICAYVATNFKAHNFIECLFVPLCTTQALESKGYYKSKQESDLEWNV